MTGLHPVKSVKSQITCSSCGLQRICFPSGMTSDEVQRLDTIITAQPVFKKGETIFTAGEPASAIYALKSGIVKLYRTDSQGNEIIHTFYLPGDIIGLDALDQPVYTFDAQALDTCNVCRLEQCDLETLSMQMPVLNRQVLQMMRRELELERAHFENMTHRVAQQRVAAFIWSMAQRYRERGYDWECFRLPILHRDTATYLGLTPETVSRILKKFQTEGVFTWRRKYVEIHDVARLQQAAGVSLEENQCPRCCAATG
ncbi:MAG TPA: cyclic nucleotide-binding domain-containing protein [Piscirickettsiaceae bacterium]|nr:cyclic nucleotide-binding domain-containing protein [Piscirickettsiaceae bacterium]HIQ40461.1 cyclic nucleotide-binding domain-containing protein [Sulfurivirga caldicuralii]